MTEPESEPAITRLLAKLDSLQLEDDERDLLTAILRIAQDVTEMPEAGTPMSFSEQFATAFTSSKADLVVSYASATGSLSGISRGISRHTHGGSTSPAGISRLTGISRHTTAHDEHPHDDDEDDDSN
jgi:hypothetical protein